MTFSLIEQVITTKNKIQHFDCILRLLSKWFLTSPRYTLELLDFHHQLGGGALARLLG